MERYEAYKDSGVPWVGEIPEEWITYPFQKFFSFSKGLAITKANLVEKGLPVISYGQIHSKSNSGVKSHPELLRRVSEDDEALSDSAMTVTGDIVFADTSEDSDGCGNCFYIDRDGIYAGYHTFIAHPLQLGWERYHSYLFQSDEWRSQVRSRANGVKLFSVTQRILGDNTLLLPTKEEAIIIADYLDERTAEIDSIVSETERSIELLREYRKSIISEAVTKGLDPNVPMKDSGVEWIGEIPETWGLPKLGLLLKGTKDGTHSSYKRVELGRPLLSAKNVRETEVVITDHESMISEDDYKEIISCGYPRNGDVLLTTIGGSIGRSVVYSFDEQHAFQRSVIFLRSDSKVLLSKYLCYMLRSELMQRQMFARSSASAQDGIYAGDIVCYKAVLPSLDGQKQIIDYLDIKTSEIDALIADKERQVELLKEYRKSLISEAVTGKFKVPGVR